MTLFLGLVFGLQPVQVAVGAGVTSVDVLLDGRPVAVVTAPPWTVSIDFGSLEPHVLLAVARDASGAEIGRASQRVNLPRAQAEASLALLPGSGGRNRVARLNWASTVRAKPLNVRVWLDGLRVMADDPSNLALPPFAPAETHVLRAEVSFAHDVVATAELVFAGMRSESAETDLTAVPVVFEGRVPREAEMNGWLTAAGRPVRVAAVDSGSGDIVVVRDEAAIPPLRKIRLPARSDRMLATGQRIWLCWPSTPKAAPGYDVFPLSPDYSPLQYLHKVLGEAKSPIKINRPRLADAVAAAGLWAAARNNPRVVLLIHAGSEDASHLGPETVRRYLRSLNVPLLVWAVDEGDGSRSAPWGDVETVRDAPGLKAASDRLLTAVSGQKIVWLEGAHLPQAISLSPQASFVSIAR